MKIKSFIISIAVILAAAFICSCSNSDSEENDKPKDEWTKVTDFSVLYGKEYAAYGVDMPDIEGTKSDTEINFYSDGNVQYHSIYTASTDESYNKLKKEFEKEDIISTDDEKRTVEVGYFVDVDYAFPESYVTVYKNQDLSKLKLVSKGSSAIFTKQ